jgi:pyruvate dehydrogenase (quinone)
MASVSEQIVRALAASGVGRVHTAGRSALADAVDLHPTVRRLPASSAHSAAFAAVGDATVTGEPAVCVGLLAPSALPDDPTTDDLLDGLLDARGSRVPVLAIAITADAAAAQSTQVRGAALDPVLRLRSLRLSAERLTAARDLPRVVAAAMRSAVEHCAPAVILVDRAMLDAAVPDDALPATHGIPAPVTASRPIVRPRESDLATAAERLGGARRICIVAGAGAAGAHDELMLLAETLRAPVAHTLRGKEHVEGGNPFDVGMVGPLSSGWADDAVGMSDLVLLLGADLRYPGALSTGSTVIQVDVRGSRLGRRGRVDLGLTGTVVDTLRALQPRLDRHFDQVHLDHALDGYRGARRADDRRALAHEDSAAASVAALVNRLAESDAAFVLEAGAEQLSAARYLRMNGDRALVGSFSHGSPSAAVPLAVGAQSAHPDRQVVALLGDRGPGPLASELRVLARSGLPVKLVGLAAEHDRSLGAAAGRLGILGIAVERPAGLEQALTEALDYDGPAVLQLLRR